MGFVIHPKRWGLMPEWEACLQLRELMNQCNYLILTYSSTSHMFSLSQPTSLKHLLFCLPKYLALSNVNHSSIVNLLDLI